MNMDSLDQIRKNNDRAWQKFIPNRKFKCQRQRYNYFVMLNRLDFVIVTYRNGNGSEPPPPRKIHKIKIKKNHKIMYDNNRKLSVTVQLH